MHCGERGALLEKLRKFYGRTTDTTARLAEKSVKEQLKLRIAALEAEVTVT